MATSATTAESGVEQTEQERTIEAGRFRRACTEAMGVTFTAPGIADIASASGNTYEVELEGGVCKCLDYQNRGGRFICKHVQRAALVALYDDEQTNTELVAQVARYARNTGCQHEERGCAGPTTTANRLDGLPCPGCCDAVRSANVDEWTVWNRLVAPGREVR